MGKSLKLFTVRDIEIRVHITFPLILIWAGLQFGLLSGSLTGAMFGIVAISLLFILVTLHELGHSFVAQHYGVPVKQIILTPLGGIAQLTEIPENPRQELLVAIAGPAVNVVVAILMGVTAVALGISFGNPLAVLSGTAGFTVTALFAYVFIYNIVLALFNLLPGFPMDGGRILRALLAMRLEYVRATNIAANIGRLTAFLMGLWGLFNGSIFLILIAFFIFVGAGQEAAMVRLRSVLRGYQVKQVYSPSAYRLVPDSTVQQARNLALYGKQHSFAVVEGHTMVGFVTRQDLVSAISTAVPHTPVSRIMRRDIRPVASHDNLFDVQQRMTEEHMEALPVVDGGLYMGLISRRQIADFHGLLASEPEVVTA